MHGTFAVTQKPSFAKEIFCAMAESSVSLSYLYGKYIRSSVLFCTICNSDNLWNGVFMQNILNIMHYGLGALHAIHFVYGTFWFAAVAKFTIAQFSLHNLDHSWFWKTLLFTPPFIGTCMLVYVTECVLSLKKMFNNLL